VEIHTKAVIVLLVTILIVLITTLHGNAADKWSRQDYQLEAVCLVLKAVDWRQTVYIAKHPVRYKEWNPVLGKHPSKSQVNTYFALTAVGHVFVTHVLPAKWRSYWQCFWIGLSGYNVARNVSIGIKIRF